MALLLVTPQVSFAKTKEKAKPKVDWGYKGFPLVKPQEKDYLPIKIQLGKQVLDARMRPGSGTHMMWGVEQIYTDRTFKKYVAVKKNVKVYGENVVGGWRAIAKGQVLHLRLGTTVTAYYAEGLTNKERFFFESKIRKHHKVSDFTDFLIQKAYAETTGTGVGQDPTTPVRQELSLGPRQLAIDAAICMAARAGDATLEAGGNAIEAIGNATAAAWNDPSGAATSAWNWARNGTVAAWNGAGEMVGNAWSGAGEAMRAAWNGSTDAISYVGRGVWDGTIWDDISDSVEKTKLFLQKAYTFVAGSVEGFIDLPFAAKTEILCEFGIQAAKVGAIGLVMAATGVGVAAAGARLMAFVGRFGASMMAMLPNINRIARMENLSENERVQQIRELFRREGGNGDGTRTVAGAGVDDRVSALPINRQAAARLGLDDEEYRDLLTRNMAGDLPDADRLRLASEALGGRALSAEQGAAVLRAHETGVLRADGTFSQADLLAKNRILREAGFSPEEIRSLMDRGITGRAGVANAPNPFSSDDARTSLIRAGVPEERMNRILSGFGYGQRADLNLAERHQIWGAINEEGVATLRNGDLAGARRIFEQANNVLLENLDVAVAEGRDTSGYFARAFAHRNFGNQGLGQVPRSDPLFDRAMESGYFSDRFRSGATFQDVFDPMARGNPDRYDPRAIGLHGTDPYQVYASANRQVEELMGIASYLGRNPRDVPPWLEGVSQRQVLEYLRTYRQSMQNIQTQHLGL